MTALPEGFENLQPFVATWALPTSADRAARRGDSTAAERQALYDAVTPQLSAALELLDAKPLLQFGLCERNLLNLCLAAAHVALAVEALGSDEANHAPHRNQMIITRTPADT